MKFYEFFRMFFLKCNDGFSCQAVEKHQKKEYNADVCDSKQFCV
jgi:hypothetical protein